MCEWFIILLLILAVATAAELIIPVNAPEPLLVPLRMLLPVMVSAPLHYYL
jgi:hypothetical protein